MFVQSCVHNWLSKDKCSRWWNFYICQSSESHCGYMIASMKHWVSIFPWMNFVLVLAFCSRLSFKDPPGWQTCCNILFTACDDTCEEMELPAKGFGRCWELAAWGLWQEALLCLLLWDCLNCTFQSGNWLTALAELRLLNAGFLDRLILNASVVAVPMCWYYATF